MILEECVLISTQPQKNTTFTTFYHHPNHKYISERLSTSSNISLAPRIFASTNNNAILYANFLSSTVLQYRQHVHNKTNFESYGDSRWDVYSSWQWKDRYPDFGFVVIENFTDANKFLKKVKFSQESKEILSLKEDTNGCVNFESSHKNYSFEKVLSLVDKMKTPENDHCGHEK